jgi:hypothetical protein
MIHMKVLMVLLYVLCLVFVSQRQIIVVTVHMKTVMPLFWLIWGIFGKSHLDQ